ncbi:hypothetical protein [Mycobacterium sp.]|uniref:hypothetical protein n=1 Tax=Mycobacterium sp. TaxID=1785 RepID=UPI003F9C3736
MSKLQRRKWVPDVRMIADQLIADYRSATFSVEGIGGPGERIPEGDLDAIGTMASWLATAADHGEEFQEDDWICLVQELASRAAWPRGPGVTQ